MRAHTHTEFLLLLLHSQVPPRAIRFGLTPGPQPTFTLRPSQYRERPGQGARPSEGLREECLKRH
jgi:hypothetical protein